MNMRGTKVFPAIVALAAMAEAVLTKEAAR